MIPLAAPASNRRLTASHASLDSSFWARNVSNLVDRASSLPPTMSANHAQRAAKLAPMPTAALRASTRPLASPMEPASFPAPLEPPLLMVSAFAPRAPSIRKDVWPTALLASSPSIKSASPVYLPALPV